MTIAQQIAEEHQWATLPDGQQKECTCGALIAMHPADHPLPFHVAEMTEQAVREHIAQQLEERAATGMSQRSHPYWQAATREAAVTARGDDR